MAAFNCFVLKCVFLLWYVKVSFIKWLWIWSRSKSKVVKRKNWYSKQAVLVSWLNLLYVWYTFVTFSVLSFHISEKSKISRLTVQAVSVCVCGFGVVKSTAHLVWFRLTYSHICHLSIRATAVMLLSWFLVNIINWWQKAQVSLWCCFNYELETVVLLWVNWINEECDCLETPMTAFVLYTREGNQICKTSNFHQDT